MVKFKVIKEEHCSECDGSGLVTHVVTKQDVAEDFTKLAEGTRVPVDCPDCDGTGTCEDDALISLEELKELLK